MENVLLIESRSQQHISSKAIRALLVFATLILFFFFSMYFSALHNGGDQIHYTNAYYRIGGLNFFEALNVYRTIIYSYEPIHFVVCWVGSSLGVDKNILMSLLNVLLLVLAYKYLKSRKYSEVISLLILFTNYYLFVMFFTLEKLKIAFIFMLIFLLSMKRPLLAVVSFVASIFSHFQMIIIALLEVGSRFFVSIGNGSISKHKLLKLIFFMLCAGVLGVMAIVHYWSFIASKVQFYFNFSRGQGILSLRSVVLTFILTYFCTEKRKQALFYFLGLSVAILLLGGDRLNMFAYFGFLHYINPKKIVSKASVVLLSGYLLYKTALYLVMIYRVGG